MNPMEINFLKLVLLLMKGGLLILRKLLLSIVLSTKKEIGDILSEHRKVIDDCVKRKIITAHQLQILFPDDETKTNPDNWDISLLTFVLLNCLQSTMDKQMEQAIKKIRDKRNDLLAHRSSPALNTVEFRCSWDDLHLTLSALSRNLTSTDQTEFGQIVEEISNETMTSERVQRDQLDQLPKEDEFRETLYKKLFDDLVEKTEELKSRLEEKEKRDKESLQKHEVKIKEHDIKIQMHEDQISMLMKLHIKSPNETTRVQAQDDVLKRLNPHTTEGAASNYEQDELGECIQSLVQDIKDKGGVLKKAEEGSVLLTIICSSKECVKKIAEYLAGPKAKEKIINIQRALQKRHSECVTIDVQMIDVSAGFGDVADEQQDCTTISTTLLCEDIEDVRQLIQYFGSGDLRIRLTELSQALTKSNGDNVEVMAQLELPIVQNTGSEVCPIKTENKKIDRYSLKADDSYHYSFIHDVHSKPTLNISRQIRRAISGSTGKRISIDESEMLYLYWCKSVYAFGITCNALRAFVVEVFYDFLTSWDLDDRMHLTHFLKECFNKRIETSSSGLSTTCQGCKLIAQRISSKHLHAWQIDWANVGPSFLPEYWRIARLFVTDTRFSHHGMEILQILEHFTGFETRIPAACLKLFAESANKLCNDGERMCTTQEMETLFTRMIDLLTSDTFKQRPDCYIALLKLTQIQHERSLSLVPTVDDDICDVTSVEDIVEEIFEYKNSTEALKNSSDQKLAVQQHMHRLVHATAEALYVQQYMREKAVVEQFGKELFTDVHPQYFFVDTEIDSLFIRILTLDNIMPYSLVRRTIVGTFAGVGLCIFGGRRNIYVGLLGGIACGTASYLLEQLR